MASSTTVIELDSIASALPTTRYSKDSNANMSHINNSRTSLNNKVNEVNENLTPRNSVVEQVQRWNQPRINIYRLGAAFWGFIIMGANDAVIGV
jgi:hypothetical protein